MSTSRLLPVLVLSPVLQWAREFTEAYIILMISWSHIWKELKLGSIIIWKDSLYYTGNLCMRKHISPCNLFITVEARFGSHEVGQSINRKIDLHNGFPVKASGFYSWYGLPILKLVFLGERACRAVTNMKWPAFTYVFRSLFIGTSFSGLLGVA